MIILELIVLKTLKEINNVNGNFNWDRHFLLFSGNIIHRMNNEHAIHGNSTVNFSR